MLFVSKAISGSVIMFSSGSRRNFTNRHLSCFQTSTRNRSAASGPQHQFFRSGGTLEESLTSLLLCGFRLRRACSSIQPHSDRSLYSRYPAFFLWNSAAAAVRCHQRWSWWGYQSDRSSAFLHSKQSYAFLIATISFASWLADCRGHTELHLNSHLQLHSSRLLKDLLVWHWSVYLCSLICCLDVHPSREPGEED